jgi:hypothetical protein
MHVYIVTTVLAVCNPSRSPTISLPEQCRRTFNNSVLDTQWLKKGKVVSVLNYLSTTSLKTYAGRGLLHFS